MAASSNCERSGLVFARDISKSTKRKPQQDPEGGICLTLRHCYSDMEQVVACFEALPCHRSSLHYLHSAQHSCLCWEGLDPAWMRPRFANDVT